MSYYQANARRFIGGLRKHRPCFAEGLRGELPDGQIEGVLTSMEAAFEALLPRLPDIGGDGNMLTENLLISAWFLALIQTVERHGLSDAATARITERAAAEIVRRRASGRGWPVRGSFSG